MPTLRERQLAIVLLDLIGSTDFVQKHGARKSAEWFQYHDRLARSLLRRFDGREIDRSDGFLLSFERIQDAVTFALVYQDTIPNKTRLETRIGVHWGPVVEVEQDELETMVGAKRFELEGISKNITARVMSMCRPRQVLLTSEAWTAVRGRLDSRTPKGSRFACVGLYRLKGIQSPQVLYAVGTTIESLQPPPSTEKTKRLGGPKRIRSHLRHMRLREFLWWLMLRLATVSAVYITVLLLPFLMNEDARKLWGLDTFPFQLFSVLRDIILFIRGLYE